MNDKLNIYEYLDYRSFLKNMYSLKKQENPNFSFRSFSRVAGLKSSNFLKLVMDGKRNLSTDTIQKFAGAFKLTKEETNFFETMVLFNQSISTAEKNRYYDKITQSKHYLDTKPLEANQYVYFSSWHFVALRELVLLKDFQEDPQWINQKLQIKLNPVEIKRAFRILLELKLLERDDSQRLTQTAEKIAVTPEMGSLALVNYHREMLRKASDSLEKSQTSHRDISALTIAISKKKFDQIQERIKQFRAELHALAVDDDDDRSAVYQVNFQLFNLSEVPWK